MSNISLIWWEIATNGGKRFTELSDDDNDDNFDDAGGGGGGGGQWWRQQRRRHYWSIVRAKPYTNECKMAKMRTETIGERASNRERNSSNCYSRIVCEGRLHTTYLSSLLSPDSSTIIIQSVRYSLFFVLLPSIETKSIFLECFLLEFLLIAWCVLFHCVHVSAFRECDWKEWRKAFVENLRNSFALIFICKPVFRSLSDNQPASQLVNSKMTINEKPSQLKKMWRKRVANKKRRSEVKESFVRIARKKRCGHWIQQRRRRYFKLFALKWY